MHIEINFKTNNSTELKFSMLFILKVQNAQYKNHEIVTTDMEMLKLSKSQS